MITGLCLILIGVMLISFPLLRAINARQVVYKCGRCAFTQAGQIGTLPRSWRFATYGGCRCPHC